MNSPPPELERCRIELDGPIATLTLCDVEGGNVMGWEMFRELRDATTWLIDRDDVRALIIIGEGRAFSLGGDMHGWYGEWGEAPDPGRHARWLGARAARMLNEVLLTVRQMPFLTIAAINGHTVGAAVGFALTCDLRIASQDARVLLGYARVGLSPDGGVSWLLPRIVGEATALSLLLDDKPLRGARLLELGLVHRVVPGEELREETHRWADRLVRRNPPLYVRSVKQLLVQQRASSFAETLHCERELLVRAVSTDDTDRALSAFADGRTPPEFHGWLTPDDAPTTTVPS